MDLDVISRWLAGNGAGGVSTAIHPDDEMAAYLRRLERPGIEYFRSGYEAFAQILAVATATGIDLESDGLRILDFACGWGRTTRFLVDRFGSERVEGCEIAPTGVAFVRETFGVTMHESTPDPADLKLPGGYDLIWVGSLFTHLPRATYVRWLSTLLDRLAPGGVLAYTTHPLTRLPGDATGARSDDGGSFVFLSQSEADGRLDLQEYGSTYVTPEHAAALAREAGARSVAHADARLWSAQDIHLASRDANASLDAWRPASGLRGEITGVTVDVARHGRAGGGVIVLPPVDLDPLREVVVDLDGNEIARLPASEESSWIEEDSGGRVHDWFVEGDLTPFGVGSHLLTVDAVRASGARSTVSVARFEVPDGA